MKNMAELYIDFYSKYEASIRVSLSDSGERTLLYEVFLFSAFVLQQMQNLNGTGIDDAIARALIQVEDSTVDTFNLGNYINASDIDVKIPTIVGYRGKGNKRFNAEFNIINSSPTIRVHPKGFGLLGKEVNYYALQSINALLKYFTIKYSNTSPNKYVFSDASNLCGREYVTCKNGIGIRSINQGQVVTNILKQLFPK
jgi:hypothetical protein